MGVLAIARLAIKEYCQQLKIQKQDKICTHVIYLVAIKDIDTGQFSFFNNFQYFQLLDVDNSDKDAF